MSRQCYRPFTINLQRTGEHPSGFQGFHIGLQKTIEEQLALWASTPLLAGKAVLVQLYLISRSHREADLRFLYLTKLKRMGWEEEEDRWSCHKSVVDRKSTRLN